MPTEDIDTFEDMRETLKDTEEILGMVCRMFQETYHDALELKKQQDELLEALKFAQSVIKSGEPWTSTCEEVIGKTIKKTEGE